MYAIINHYGSLSFGHYLSLIKQDNQWYQYDDSHRTPLAESSLQKDAAYILFYLRKDVAKTTRLDLLIPNIEKSLFPGKPVQVKGRDAFILSEEASEQFVIKYSGKEGERERVARGEIEGEKDNEEIKYDEKERGEIEKVKMETKRR